jgi:hypothetical protein
MTKHELKGFRNVFGAEKTEWANVIRNTRAIAIETNSDVLGQIQHSIERELDQGRLERESNLLYNVRSAPRRTDTNMFGLWLKNHLCPITLANLHQLLTEGRRVQSWQPAF